MRRLKPIIVNLLLCITFFYCNLAMSQSIEKSSIDNGGASVTVGNIEILYTIGEVNVQELSAVGIQASEGFINNTVVVTLMINENEINLTNVTVYPNPASGMVSISSSLAVNRIELYNLLGKKVMESTLKTSEFDVSQLATGVYVLNIHAEKSIEVKKIIVE